MSESGEGSQASSQEKGGRQTNVDGDCSVITVLIKESSYQICITRAVLPSF